MSNHQPPAALASLLLAAEGDEQQPVRSRPASWEAALGVDSGRSCAASSIATRDDADGVPDVFAQESTRA